MTSAGVRGSSWPDVLALGDRDTLKRQDLHRRPARHGERYVGPEKSLPRLSKWLTMRAGWA